jgi:hypothetical protein
MFSFAPRNHVCAHVAPARCVRARCSKPSLSKETPAEPELIVPRLKGMSDDGYEEVCKIFNNTYEVMSKVRENSLGYPGFEMETGIPKPLEALGTICIGTALHKCLHH